MGAGIATDPHCAELYHVVPGIAAERLGKCSSVAAEPSLLHFPFPDCASAAAPHGCFVISRLARRLSFRFAIPRWPHIAATRTDNKVISSRLRVQHAFVIGPCITGLNGRFRRLRPVDYDVKVSWLSESRQRKST